MDFLINFDRKLKKIELFLAVLAGIIALILMVLITLDVILRFFFNSSIPGSFEIVTLSFIGVVFLGLPYVQSVKGNINIDIFTRKLSTKTQRILDIIGFILGLLVIVLLTWQTGVESWKSFISNDYTMGLVHIPYWPSKFMITLGLSFLTVRLLIDTLLFIFTDDANLESDQQTGHHY